MNFMGKGFQAEETASERTWRQGILGIFQRREMIPEPAGQGARNWSGGEEVSEVAGGQGRVVTARASSTCFTALLLRS